MSNESLIERTIREAMDEGARAGVLNSAQLLTDASQVKGVTLEQARGYLESAKVLIDFHAGMWPR